MGHGVTIYITCTADICLIILLTSSNILKMCAKSVHCLTFINQTVFQKDRFSILFLNNKAF